VIQFKTMIKRKQNYLRRNPLRTLHRNHSSLDSMMICTLSGTEEIGRNSNFVQYKDEILIVDMGFSFPGEELYGIDYIVPNIDYLKKNKNKIKGLLITHGHLDHTGAIPYVLKDPPYSVLVWDYGDFDIKYRVTFYVDLNNKLSAIDEFNEKYWKVFKEKGITIPYPIQEIYIHNKDKNNNE